MDLGDTTEEERAGIEHPRHGGIYGSHFATHIGKEFFSLF